MIAKIYLTNGSYTTVNENFMFSLVMCIDVEEFDIEWLEPDGTPVDWNGLDNTLTILLVASNEGPRGVVCCV